MLKYYINLLVYLLKKLIKSFSFSIKYYYIIYMLFFIVIASSFLINYINFFLISSQLSFRHSCYFNHFDFFGIVMFIMSTITILLCFVFFDNKFTKNNKKIFSVFLIIPFLIFILSVSNNIIVFFLTYEFILLPSVFLVYISSPNLRSKNVAFYFLIWTQLGSFFVFMSILLLIINIDVFFFNRFNFFFITKYNYNLISFLLFIGFGIKIPIWPFHFWLTKTHVEANTSFSVFLSGILVKTALFGLLKFSFFFIKINFFFFFWVFLGLLDSGFKLFSQVDLKRVVATCTIFEMNIILLNFLLLSYNSYIYIIYFSILHSILSFLFFFLIDSIYKRYNSRSLNSVRGILNHYPTLGIILIVSVFLFNGIPLTLKFNLEFILFVKLFNLNIVFFLLFFFLQIFFIIFFTKNFFTILFLSIKVKHLNDITTRELYIYIILILALILFSFA